MRETGHVVSLSGDAAVVAMPASGACKKCGLCMTSESKNELLLLARNEAGAQAGDDVEVDIAPGRVLAAAFIIYVIPVIMLIVGFVIGNAITGGAEEANLPIIMALVFLVVSFVGVWLIDMKLRKTERRDATVVRVLTEDEAKARRHIQPVKLGG